MKLGYQLGLEGDELRKFEEQKKNEREQKKRETEERGAEREPRRLENKDREKQRTHELEMGIKTGNQ